MTNNKHYWRIICVLSFQLSAISFQLSASFAQSQNSSGQQIGDFSLSGYGDQGKKTWEISGKSADLLENEVALQDVKGNLYGEEDNITITSKEGNFDKKEGKVKLEKDVVITTGSGAKLTTDSLEWDRKKQLVSTEDKVNIERDGIMATAMGASGQPNLNTVNLNKDVTVKLDQSTGSGKAGQVVVNCDGPLEINYEKNVAVFENKVHVIRDDTQIYCDKMEIYFLKSSSDKAAVQVKSDEPAPEDAMMVNNSKIDSLICKGNVRIVRGENVSYSDQAVYNARDKKIVLIGRPQLVLSSTDDLSMPSGK
ncbi:MAG: LPS export ABC transporter periplasmic protein LptC [Candidatus Omnitrophica bacterium]|jgi:LPS export ABC transporter protein LptC|nr:LPS export ABC transporter periplasmic protein LptC [Candidatus Omnitrophota bacterium]